MIDGIQLRIEGNRAILTGRAGNALLQLSMRLEGRKVWLKTGGFSFENTPLNMERFRTAFPGCPIEGEGEAPLAAPDWLETLSRTVSGASGQPYQGRGTPYPYQARETARSRFLPAFAILGEMGTGKSKIIIDTAGELWTAGEITAVLVIALKGVHDQWINEQFPEHLGESVPWQGAAITRDRPMPSHWSPGKLNVLSVNFDYIKKKKGRDNVVNFIKSHGGNVLMVVDESHEIKNPSAAITEACNEIGGMCRYRRITTGTPIGRNLIDALSQYQFLDERILGHRYISSFKAEYCIMGGYQMNDVLGSKNEEQFWAKVAPYTFRITKDETDLNLPPKVYDKFQFDLSDEQRHHYLALKADMITKLDSGELLTVTNAIALLTRLQQVACGFLSIKGDKEKGIPDVLQRLKNSRIEALQHVMDEREGKTIIWARFNEDIQSIKAHLGEKCVTYYGATSQVDRETAKRRFIDPHDPVVLVANPAAGGTGLNLQGHCRTVIYYSNSFDAIARWQSEDRVHRIGMKFPITYIDLVATKTIDRKILVNLRNKKSMSDLAFDDIRKMVSDDS